MTEFTIEQSFKVSPTAMMPFPQVTEGQWLNKPDLTLSAFSVMHSRKAYNGSFRLTHFWTSVNQQLWIMLKQGQ